MESDKLYLPHEIIRNILKRLPVKSLVRFQCVCKQWKCLIKNPSFIADHLQHSVHQNPSLLLFEQNTSGITVHWRMCLLDGGTQVREVQKPSLMDSIAVARIVGSCNGLLCVETNRYNKSPSLLLWNPATTTVRHVPRTRIDLFDFGEWVTGFGFSPIANYYKIVRAYEVCDGVKRVEVFSLSRGSWKEIDVGNLKGVILSYETVTANGAIFWSGIMIGAEKEDEDDVVEVIVSFDIAKEVFTLMIMPDLDFTAKFTVYENKPAVLRNSWGVDHGRPDLVHLWVMEEGTCAFGERQSWTKISTNSSCSYMAEPMTIWRNEIVCQTYSEGGNEKGSNVLYLMDVTTNEVKRFVIPCCGPINTICNYVESLVSVES